jgi:hypothetical protein
MLIENNYLEVCRYQLGRQRSRIYIVPQSARYQYEVAGCTVLQYSSNLSCACTDTTESFKLVFSFAKALLSIRMV